MKRMIKGIFSVVAFILLMYSGSLVAQAGTVIDVSVSQSNGVITVSGTVDTDVLACAILVYDSTGSTLISMETCGVSASDTYSHTFSTSFSSGDYLIKVADYNGGSYAEGTITVPVPAPAPSNPSSSADSNTTTDKKTAEETEQVATPIEHIVVRGDNLYKIAKKYGFTLKNLLNMNPQIKNPNRICVGQKIVVGYTYTTQVAGTAKEVSDVKYYTIQRGDYLNKIAKLHGMTLKELEVLNPGILKQKYIYPGQKVQVK